MKHWTNNDGLLVDNTTTPPTCAGYIFNFGQGHGAFAPGADGRMGELSQAEIDTHNGLLAQMEVDSMKKHGRAVLYEHKDKETGKWFVGTWNGSFRWPAYTREGRHNIAGTRRDFWFTVDGQRFHGVNIGDNDIVRCKQVKS